MVRSKLDRTLFSKKGCIMSKLFTFLENFEINNRIKIFDVDGNLIFEGLMRDVPQKVTNQMSVVRGTAVWKGDYLEVKVKKS